MNPRRWTGEAAVSANAVSGGTIASRSGNARAVPMPRKKVRLGNDSFVITMRFGPYLFVNVGFSIRGCIDAHLKRCAPDHSQDERREPVVARSCFASDGPYRGRI